jgi:hypothetical protein
MGFCTGALFTADVETKTFSATIAEFKGVLIQNRTADFTVKILHPCLGNKGPRVQGFK